MGMYTELHFNSALKEGVPVEVVDVLKFMLGEREHEPALPQHELFQTDRWAIMLCCDSYYFDAKTHSILYFDDIADNYYLCIRANVKNYDKEIAKFVDWITPYLDKDGGDFLGFCRYEEDEIPTLIFHPNLLVKPVVEFNKFGEVVA